MDIFLSYRRADSQDIAARLADRLGTVAGVKNVFIDVEGIGVGQNFESSITKALDKCDVCLVLVGAQWCGEAREGQTRIFETEDYVRQETRVALESGKRVIPVLLNDTTMPAEDLLPADIKPMTKLNGIFLRHHSFNQDLELLVDAVFNHKPRNNWAKFLQRNPIARTLLRSSLGVILAAVGLFFAAIAHNAITGNSLNQSFSNGIVWSIILFALIAGAVVPIFSRKGN